jgi:hypothetical protein
MAGKQYKPEEIVAKYDVPVSHGRGMTKAVRLRRSLDRWSSHAAERDPPKVW